MELRFSKSNNIRTSYSAQGLTGVVGLPQYKQYSVDLGTILYNDTFLDLNSLIIPLKDQIFFDLPQDKDKYAVVNVYYDVENGIFIFDKLGIFDKYVDKITADALFNVIPIAQFIIRESFGSFDVISYNEYSQMSTFTLSKILKQGVTGLKGDVGYTGILGETGPKGPIGWTGPIGETGYPGVTGVSYPGITGSIGETGYFIDTDLLFYLKFKNEDFKQTDFSPYERDVVFYYTGPLDSEGDSLSYFVKETGVVDSCHNIVYEGGLSSYSRSEFFPFGRETGTLSAWLKLTEKPTADFYYEVDLDNPLTLHFYDTSTNRPTSWEWRIDYDGSFENLEIGMAHSTKNATHTFPSYGQHIAKLKATNANGYNEITKFVEVTPLCSSWVGENNTIDFLRRHDAAWGGNIPAAYETGIVGSCFKLQYISDSILPIANFSWDSYLYPGTQLNATPYDNSEPPIKLFDTSTGGSPTSWVWTVDSVKLSFLNEVVYGNGLFVCSGNEYEPSTSETYATFLFSNDGINWNVSYRILIGSSFGPTKVSYANGKFYYSDFYNNNVYETTDGYNWDLNVDLSGYYSFAYFGGKYIVYNKNDNKIYVGTILNSMTATLTLSITPSESFGDIYFLNGQYVVWTYANAINSGKLYTSGDANSWNLQTLPTNVSLSGIAYGAGKYVITNNLEISSVAPLWYSSDLITWYAGVGLGVDTPNFTQNPGLTFGAGNFLAYNGGSGAGNMLYVSSDGINWTGTDAGQTNLLMFSGGVGTDGTLIFASGQAIEGLAPAYMVVSSDGVAWTKIDKYKEYSESSEFQCFITNNTDFFPLQGYYITKLTVSNDAGSDTISKTIYLKPSPYFYWDTQPSFESPVTFINRTIYASLYTWRLKNVNTDEFDIDISYAESPTNIDLLSFGPDYVNEYFPVTIQLEVDFGLTTVEVMNAPPPPVLSADFSVGLPYAQTQHINYSWPGVSYFRNDSTGYYVNAQWIIANTDTGHTGNYYFRSEGNVGNWTGGSISITFLGVTITQAYDTSQTNSHLLLLNKFIAIPGVLYVTNSLNKISSFEVVNTEAFPWFSIDYSAMTGDFHYTFIAWVTNLSSAFTNTTYLPGNNTIILKITDAGAATSIKKISSILYQNPPPM